MSQERDLLLEGSAFLERSQDLDHSFTKWLYVSIVPVGSNILSTSEGVSIQSRDSYFQS